ncbi:MAG: Hsp70 family protein [Sporichthyaceae bacterium]|nr:Hsp70 family protein [Sporichthyaceae bacterium]
MYALGIDLGTTFTAAAVWRDGRAEIATLGGRTAAIPSVVLLRDDETLLTGETANRRALTEPGRVAREFKRRLGDTTPILLAGVPYSAEALMSKLLRSVVDEVTAREGESPARICVSHPANWGPYKTDLLRQAVRMANLEQPVTLTTEPEAAAVFYAQDRYVEPGAAVAVYDLGGGTFDAAVLRKTDTGFAILGRPEGIERLGGIDFDAAVFNHVRQALGGKLDDLDDTDFAAIAAVGRLREECVDAKEALSSDTDVSIPVLLPNVSTEVRLTRTELEAMVRPALYESIEALRRALRSAGVTPDQLHSVLLVGGSSRMPIVAQLVGAELGRPVAVDAHPKHAVALGAAFLASGEVSGAREVRTSSVASAVLTPEPETAVVTEPEAARVTEPETALIAEARPALALGTAPVVDTPPDLVMATEPAVAEPDAESDDAELDEADLDEGEPDAVSDATQVRTYADYLLDRPTTEAGDRPALVGYGERPDGGPGPRVPMVVWIGGAAAVVVALVVGLIVLLGGNGDGEPGGNNPTGPGSTDVELTRARAVEVARLPDGIVADDAGALWVAATSTNEITRLDPATGQATLVPVGGGQPLALAVTDDGAVWVTRRTAAEVARIDPDSGQVTDQIPVGSRPFALSVGAGSLWVVTTSNRVERIDPQTRTITGAVELEGPTGVVVTGDAAWVTQSDLNQVSKIDLASNAVVGTIDVGRRPDTLASDGEALWVSNRGAGTLSRIDLATEQVTDTIPVGAAPAGIAIDGDRVWVIDNLDNTLVLVDRVSREVVSSVEVGARPLGLAVLGDSVWVTLSQGAAVAEVTVRPAG